MKIREKTIKIFRTFGGEKMRTKFKIYENVRRLKFKICENMRRIKFNIYENVRRFVPPEIRRCAICEFREIREKVHKTIIEIFRTSGGGKMRTKFKIYENVRRLKFKICENMRRIKFNIYENVRQFVLPEIRRCAFCGFREICEKVYKTIIEIFRTFGGGKVRIKFNIYENARRLKFKICENMRRIKFNIYENVRQFVPPEIHRCAICGFRKICEKVYKTIIKIFRTSGGGKMRIKFNIYENVRIMKFKICENARRTKFNIYENVRRFVLPKIRRRRAICRFRIIKIREKTIKILRTLSGGKMRLKFKICEKTIKILRAFGGGKIRMKFKICEKTIEFFRALGGGILCEQ